MQNMLFLCSCTTLYQGYENVQEVFTLVSQVEETMQNSRNPYQTFMSHLILIAL